MAEIKKSKRRIIDVSHPDSTAPSDTSKAVIVKNHALLKDPMMRDEAAASTDDSKPSTETPHKIETKLGTAPTLSSALEAPLAEALKKHDKPEAVEEQPADAVPEPAETALAPDAKTAEKTAEESSEMPADVVTTDPPTAKTEAPKAPEASPAAAPVPAEANEPKADEPEAQPEPKAASSPEPAATSKAEPPVATTTDSITETAEVPKGPTVEAENAAAAAAAKREAALQKLVESKKYVLPINSLEQRRTKRVVLLGLLLSLLLAAAWVDIALDAGLIHLAGLHPVTHFFST